MLQKEGVKYAQITVTELLREKAAGEFEGKPYGSQAK